MLSCLSFIFNSPVLTVQDSKPERCFLPEFRLRKYILSDCSVLFSLMYIHLAPFCHLALPHPAVLPSLPVAPCPETVPCPLIAPLVSVYLDVKWLKLLLHNVWTGKSSFDVAHSPETIHQELLAHNPVYREVSMMQNLAGSKTQRTSLATDLVFASSLRTLMARLVINFFTPIKCFTCLGIGPPSRVG